MGNEILKLNNTDQVKRPPSPVTPQSRHHDLIIPLLTPSRHKRGISQSRQLI